MSTAALYWWSSECNKWLELSHAIKLNKLLVFPFVLKYRQTNLFLYVLLFVYQMYDVQIKKSCWINNLLNSYCDNSNSRKSGNVGLFLFLVSFSSVRVWGRCWGWAEVMKKSQQRLNPSLKFQKLDPPRFSLSVWNENGTNKCWKCCIFTVLINSFLQRKM